MSNLQLQLEGKQKTLPSSTIYRVCTRSVMLCAYSVTPDTVLLSQPHRWGQYVAPPKVHR